jgi:hypothetical protein
MSNHRVPAPEFQPGDTVWIGTVGTVVDDPDTPQGTVAITYGDSPTVWYVSPRRLELIERAEGVAPSIGEAE